MKSGILPCSGKASCRTNCGGKETKLRALFVEEMLSAASRDSLHGHDSKSAADRKVCKQEVEADF